MKKRSLEKKKLPEGIIKAIYSNNVEQVAKWQNEENVNYVDKDGRSLLFHAILANSKDIFNHLLNSSDVNIKDRKGWYPLHYAVQNYQLEMIDELVSMGANIESKDDFGNTPLWRAVFASQGKGDVIKLLLSKGADINNPNNAGITPVKLANTIANYDVKQFFRV